MNEMITFVLSLFVNKAYFYARVPHNVEQVPKKLIYVARVIRKLIVVASWNYDEKARLSAN